MANNSSIIVGKIHSVALKNFVTYKEVSFYPDDYLNIIIGPNGTGKSTLLAAIILGMGGTPQLLSRSSKIEEYIKNGADESWIEIKIYKNVQRKTIQFERLFNMAGKSIWKIDGTVNSAKDYLACVSRYNIQISNLCQFLPQDRVQDFAKMNPQEILKCTISSVCSPDVLKQYESLKEMRQTQLNSKSMLKNNYVKLKDYEERNAQLKIQIDRMNIRKTLQKDIVVCELKQKWLKYLEEKENIDKIHTELKQAKVIVKRHQNAYEKIRKESLTIIKTTENYQNLIKNFEQKCQSYTKQFDELTAKSDELEASLRQAERDLKDLKDEQEEKANEMENEKKLLNAHLQDLKNALADCTPEDEQQLNNLYEQLGDLKINIKLLMEQYANLNCQIDILTPELRSIQRLIANLQNADERKLNMLRDKFDHVYQGVMWLRENQHLFEGKVYEPMILELNVRDSRYARYIEDVVSSRDLLGFVCENKKDVETLILHLCTERQLIISALHSDPASECHFVPEQRIEKYKKFGFFSYLIDMIDGPAPILNFLCKAVNLHNILAGTDEVNKHIEELPQNIQKFFAGNYFYSIMYSRYTGEPSILRSHISDKNLLSIGINTEELETLQKKLRGCLDKSDSFKNKRVSVQNELSNLEQKRNGILEEKKVIERKKHIVQQKKDRVIVQKDKIKRLETSEINIDKEEKKFNKFAQNIVPQHYKLLTEKENCLEKCQKANESYEFTRLRLNIYKKENIEIEENVRNAKEAVVNGEKLLETIAAKFNILNKKVEKYLIDIRNECNGSLPDELNFKYKKDFNKISNDLSELTEMIYEKQSQVNCMINESQSVFDEYARQCELIENLKILINEGTVTDTDLNRKILTVHSSWYPEIMKIIDIINTNFGKFMASMEYVGEIQLGRKDEFDYDTYGIEIFVQYRNNTKLQALDRFVQSGGERAVAIAVYTLSLQRITNVPFRCVDEINQGMDPRNERKIFEMLVNETTKLNQSQYFFITPKLLPDLPYNDRMTVHIVYNGVGIENHNVFNSYDWEDT